MDRITLAEGSGGKEMGELIKSLGMDTRGEWKHTDDDASVLDIGGGKHLVFTTDSFTVDPLFFPGGDIGHLAACGTINDLCMMGARPSGISLSLIIEEGFKRKSLLKVIDSFKKVCRECSIPIATGDTKVMPRGKIDGLVMNTSAVGITGALLNKKPEERDSIVLSGAIGDHAVALLSKRFDYETDIVTDSKPLIDQVESVKGLIRLAKDPTRGGLAAALNEISDRSGAGILIHEGKIPIKPQVKRVTEMLGLDPLQLACEGCFVCMTDKPETVVEALRKHDQNAAVIGEVTGDRVMLETGLGRRVLAMPKGRIVPRIC